MKAVYATGTNYDDPLSMLEVDDMPEPETKPFWSTIRVLSLIHILGNRPV